MEELQNRDWSALTKPEIKIEENEIKEEEKEETHISCDYET